MSRMLRMVSDSGNLRIQGACGIRHPQVYVVAYSAGSPFAGSPHGDSVWLFSLKGTLSEGGAGSVTTAVPVAEH
jgi:hypothetical protein